MAEVPLYIPGPQGKETSVAAFRNANPGCQLEKGRTIFGSAHAAEPAALRHILNEKGIEFKSFWQ